MTIVAPGSPPAGIPWFEAEPATAGPAQAWRARLAFVRPLIGWPAASRFTIRGLGPDLEPFALMASLDQPLEFVVVPPGAMFPDYVVEVPDDDARALGLQSADDAVVLAFVSRGSGDVPSVNLMGPLVVNRRDGRCAQLVLQGAGYGPAVPIDAHEAHPGPPAPPHRGR